MSVKRLGSCSICDKEIYEITLRYTTPPLERIPRKLGKPTNDAWKVEFVLRDGSTMSLSFCEDCKKKLTEAQYPALWKKVMESWIFEMRDDVRKVLPTKPLTDKERAHIEKWLESQTDNGMLGVISSIKLQEAIHA